MVSAVAEQVSCDLDGEAAILQLQSGVYYTLNPVGARVWALIQQPIRVSDLHAALLAQYDAPPDRLERDLDALLQDLSAEGLVEVRP